MDSLIEGGLLFGIAAAPCAWFVAKLFGWII